MNRCHSALRFVRYGQKILFKSVGYIADSPSVIFLHVFIRRFMNTSSLVQKVWNFCHTLRDNGVGYGDYRLLFGLMLSST